MPQAQYLHQVSGVPAANPQIPSCTKNDLDRWRQCGRDVSDGGIPHGFHTNDRVKLHHPAQPRKTRDAKNAMKPRNEAECAGGEPSPPSGPAGPIVRQSVYSWGFLRLIIWLETQVCAPFTAILRRIRVESEAFLSRI